RLVSYGSWCPFQQAVRLAPEPYYYCPMHPTAKRQPQGKGDYFVPQPIARKGGQGKGERSDTCDHEQPGWPSSSGEASPGYPSPTARSSGPGILESPLTQAKSLSI